MTTFAGIPLAALDFYESLEADNSKAFWSAHKEVYETAVRAPLVALAAELADDFGEVSMFRPYRDVRFSADKSPYKTSQGAWFAKGGYVSVSASGLFVGGGYWQMASDQIERYRKATDEEHSGAQLVAIVDELRSVGYEVGGDKLKTRPRGIPAEHPRLELLRHRSLTAHREFGAPEWLPTRTAATYIRDALHEIAPLSGWLDLNVRASEMPASRR